MDFVLKFLVGNMYYILVGGTLIFFFFRFLLGSFVTRKFYYVVNRHHQSCYLRPVDLSEKPREKKQLELLQTGLGFLDLCSLFFSLLTIFFFIFSYRIDGEAKEFAFSLGDEKAVTEPGIHFGIREKYFLDTNPVCFVMVDGKIVTPESYHDGFGYEIVEKKEKALQLRRCFVIDSKEFVPPNSRQELISFNVNSKWNTEYYLSEILEARKGSRPPWVWVREVSFLQSKDTKGEVK